MNPFSDREAWFITGSQHLYGEEVLQQVAADSGVIVDGLNAAGAIPIRIVFKPVLTTPEAITNLVQEANADPRCVGLITWMHTFSPAKMWIRGSEHPGKAICPSAHAVQPRHPLGHHRHGLHEPQPVGPRWPRVRLHGHPPGQEPQGHRRPLAGCRSAGRAGWLGCVWPSPGRMPTSLKIARFGDNMRQVAVTEGDKVEAQLQLGYEVNGYGLGDLVRHLDTVTEKNIDELVAVYDAEYTVAPALRPGGARRESLRDAARIELGLRTFLDDGGFQAFTTTFENLHGLKQLPGIAVQRLMADGYGFGAEGDWKTAALVRTMKVMGAGLPGGTSFMEDYTYHFAPGDMKVLGAHMLEICPSIAAGKPSAEIHPLGIGGKDDPARLVFDTPRGPGLNAALIDMGNHFRLLVNAVEVVAPDEPLPNLPVARAVWVPQPNLRVAAAAWILAGGAHHTGFSQTVTVEQLEDYAEMAGLEFVLIDAGTTIRGLKQELRHNAVYYRLAQPT